MKVLAADTSTEMLSLAIAEGEKLIANVDSLLGRKLSSHLVPMIDEMLRASNMELGEIGGFIVGLGPGSFTGLRVGITTMKGLAFAMGKPIVGVPTLDIIAHNAICSTQLICPILDAKKQQVYASIYQSNNGELRRISPYLLVTVDRLLEKIESSTLFIGDGIALYHKEITRTLGKRAQLGSKSLWFPKATVMARLGIERLKKGERDDLNNLVPMYLYSKECSIKKAPR